MTAAYRTAVESQRAAADPGASVFVTANAGSGKTKVLIDRIARLLLAGSPPSSFLCITYTKAAAAEMQRRLFDRLGAWSVLPDEALRAELAALRGADTDRDATLRAEPLWSQRATGNPPQDDLARARALFARALETPGGLKIQTIHAFCERLLARFPLEAGVAPGFDIADDAARATMVEAAWTAIALGADAAARGALGHFAARLSPDRLRERLQALVAARAEILADINRLGGLEAAIAHAFAARGADPADSDAAICQEALAAAPFRALKAVAERLSADGGKTNLACAQDIAAATEAYAQARRGDDPGLFLAAFEAYAGVFFTDKGEPYANRPTGKLRAAHDDADQLFDAALGEPGRLQAVKQRRRALARAADAAAGLRLAHALEQAFTAAKARRSLLDFDDLIDRARRLLQDPAAAPWVLYKLDGGVDHILIDEGQDTSPGQWDLLNPLQAEFFAGEGARTLQRTVFAVGDPKQSIYSFQGADPGRFLAEAQALAQRAAHARAAFVAPALTMSFRSCPEVLAAVDAVFDGLDAAGDPPELFNLVRHVARRADEPGAVELWPLSLRPQPEPGDPWEPPNRSEAVESAQARLARAIAEDIRTGIAAGRPVWERGQRRGMHAGDVLILVRHRGPLFRELLRACKAAGLPVAGADRMVLPAELAVQDALALMRVALDPFDDLSLATVLKGPWVGWDAPDEADLIALAHGRGPGETLWARLEASDAPHHQAAAAFIRMLIARRGLDPFSFLSAALEETDAKGFSGWRKVFAGIGPEAADPLQELLARAACGPPGEPETLQHFLARIDADAAQVKRELEGADRAVRIMTVHGAKGLEAPIVYLPDTTAKSEKPPQAGVMTAPGASLAISANKGEDDPIAAQARAERERRELGEHWRLLYVAMTRAADRLILCGHGRGPGLGKAEADSWYARAEQRLGPLGAPCDTPFGEGRLIGPASAPVSAGPGPSQTEAAAPPWLFAPAREGADGAEVAPSRGLFGAALSPIGGLARFQRGRLIHALLHRLADLPADQRAAAGLRWLARQNTPEAQAEALLAEALAVIDAPFAAPAFGPNSRGEAPIVGQVGGRLVRGVVDRIAFAPEGALVIDFKTDRPSPATVSATPAGYVLQMALYRAVIGAITPGKPVRCALIWTEAPSLLPLPEEALDAALAAAGLVEA